MVEYKFNKAAVEEMYNDTLKECFGALEKGTIDKMYIKIEMGNQFVKIPMNADYFEEVFASIKECLEDL